MKRVVHVSIPSDSKYLGYGEHSNYIDEWQQYMVGGLIDGKPFSATTIKYYTSYVTKFLDEYNTLTIKNLTKALMKILPDQYGKRDKFFKSIVCFAKFLVRKEILKESFLQECSRLRPKKNPNPKREDVKQGDLEKLMNACQTPLETLIVVLLSETGLRASEAGDLRIEDVHIAEGYIHVRHGKGDKTRYVGINTKLSAALTDYLATRNGYLLDHPLLLNKKGEAMDRHGIRHILDKIGERSGVKVHAHALRRSFVTIKHSHGKPLTHLQIACGHSDIKTTRDYCRTTVEEVIKAMQEWD